MSVIKDKAGINSVSKNSHSAVSSLLFKGPKDSCFWACFDLLCSECTSSLLCQSSLIGRQRRASRAMINVRHFVAFSHFKNNFAVIMQDKPGWRLFYSNVMRTDSFTEEAVGLLEISSAPSCLAPIWVSSSQSRASWGSEKCSLRPGFSCNPNRKLSLSLSMVFI